MRKNIKDQKQNYERINNMAQLLKKDIELRKRAYSESSAMLMPISTNEIYKEVLLKDDTMRSIIQQTGRQSVIPDTARLSVKQIAEITGLAKKTIYQKIQDGVLVARISIRNNTKFVLGSELKRWYYGDKQLSNLLVGCHTLNSNNL
ncbi:MAG: helix-turn-helix domain-containing protein [Bacteroidales bacterium]|jgi:predicted DNA-binding transcriptional regulator AlpA|nr:helix-turn-helix domain-containing protein [Bacteroidales bacterium]